MVNWMTTVMYCIQNILQKSSWKAGRQRHFLLLNGTLFSNWSAQHVTLNQTPENLIEGFRYIWGILDLKFHLRSSLVVTSFMLSILSKFVCFFWFTCLRDLYWIPSIHTHSKIPLVSESLLVLISTFFAYTSHSLLLLRSFLFSIKLNRRIILVLINYSCPTEVRW